jgi:hypothetical protein
MELINKKVLFDAIKDVEIELSRKDSTITIRSFVEYFNANYNHLEIYENRELKALFKEFYYDNSKHTTLQFSLLNRFFENDGFMNYINLNAIDMLPVPLNLKNNEEYFKNVNNCFSFIEKSLKVVEDKAFLDSIYKLEQDLKKIKVIDVISLTGASKVEEKFREARKIFYNYKGLVDKYNLIKIELLLLFREYEKIRDILKYLREDLMNMLVDIYGQNVKVTHPDLFDFDNVHWIDFEGIINNLEINFNNIEETCKTFFTNHKDTYTRFSNSSMNRLEQMNGSKGALKSAAVDIGIDALISLSETNQNAKLIISNINIEIEYMKDSFWKDSKIIRLDIMRLLEIHKNIKEYLVPATKLFTTGFSKIFENEIKQDFNLASNVEEVKPFRNRNEILALELRDIEIELFELDKLTRETKELIDYYQLNLDYYQNDFDYAMTNVPIMPTRWIMLLSLGTSVNIFYKMHNHWDIRTISIRNKYNNNLENLNKENNRLQKHQLLIDNFLKTKSELNIKITDNSEQINKILKDEISLKEVINRNFKNIANLSQTAKRVLEVRLDQKLLEVVDLDF